MGEGEEERNREREGGMKGEWDVRRILHVSCYQ